MSRCGCHGRRAGAVCGCPSSAKRSKASARVLKSAGALCGKWAALSEGAEVPCRSKLLGRKLALRLPGSARGNYTVEACAVPRDTVRASKACTTAFLVREDRGLFGRAALELADGGKVRNASRTPRPTHAGMTVEWLSGRIIDGPRNRLRDNRDTGAELLDGIDLPYPHRVGSSVCCPDSALSALALQREVMDAADTTGEVSAEVLGRIRKLAKHLAAKHGGSGVEASGLRADDIDGLFRVVTAGAEFCAKYVSDWQQTAEESHAIRAEEARKRAARKRAARKRATERAGSGNSRAVKALLRAARAAK